MGGGGDRKWRFVQQKSNACSVGHEKLILFLKPISCTPKDAFLDICILACGWCYQPLYLIQSFVNSVKLK